MTEPLRIATFNLETLHASGKAGEASLGERFVVLRPALERLRADILCLQEVDGERQGTRGPRDFRVIEALIRGTSYEGFGLAGTHQQGASGARDKHNLVILSRFPFGAVGQHANDFVRPPQVPSVDPAGAAHTVSWDRPILHAVIPLPDGRPLHIINVHLRAPLASHIEGAKLSRFVWASVPAWAEGFFLSTLKRSGQALEVRLLLERIFDAEETPLVAVCGDFNCDSHEMPARLVMASEDDTGNGRLAARALVPLDRAVPRSLRYSSLHHGRPQMVDNIMVSRFLLEHLRHVEVHNESLGDELIGPLTVDRAPVSYHAPVLGVFDLEMKRAAQYN